MALREQIYFLRQLPRSYGSIGALAPTSAYAARAMASEFMRRHGPRAVLEVGPGTGAITAAIVQRMGPDDRLVLVELNADFVAYLEWRFAHDPALARVRDRVTIVHGDVTEVALEQRFDLIISTIPFANLSAATIAAIFAAYAELLEPDGVLTYIEYALLRRVKPLLMFGERRRATLAASAALDATVARHEFRCDLVVRNLPPAWVRHLRLGDPPVAAALELTPAEHNRRIPFFVAISSEALPWLVALLALGFVPGLRRTRLLLALGAAATAAFFRDPPRAVIPDSSVAYAAADGCVLAVERVREDRFGSGEWLRIGVAPSPRDVHLNRSPIAGKVARVARPSRGEADRAVYTTVESVYGLCVLAQHPGALGRRIANWCRPGELLAQGDRFGCVGMGARADVYLPADRFGPLVGPGDRVRAGETPIARNVF